MLHHKRICLHSHVEGTHILRLTSRLRSVAELLTVVFKDRFLLLNLIILLYYLSLLLIIVQLVILVYLMHLVQHTGLLYCAIGRRLVLLDL